MFAVRTITPFMILLATGSRAVAKESHFEQIRVLLISKAAKCTSCHSDESGASLNDYGRRIGDQDHDLPMADRIAVVEHGPSSDMDAAEKKRAVRDQDVDGDGTPNWVEVLAGNDPSKKDDMPDAVTRTRIERTVSCNICHSETNQAGEGLEANPHNSFGKLMASTFAKPRGKAPVGEESVRSASERTPILKRLSLVAGKKPRGSTATYWEKLRLFHLPGDSKDNPSRQELSTFKRWVSRQRRAKTRDTNYGLNTHDHPPDGFLRDADRKLE